MHPILPTAMMKPIKPATNSQGLPLTAARMPIPRTVPIPIQTAKAQSSFMAPILPAFDGGSSHPFRETPRSISVRLISTGLERGGSLKDIFGAPMPRIVKLSNVPSGGADTRMVESNRDSTCGWGESVFLPLNLRLAADLT